MLFQWRIIIYIVQNLRARFVTQLKMQSNSKAGAARRSNADSNQPVEIIPGRLYWISDQNPPKSRQHAFYFCIDNDLVYEPFFADFGPLDLGKVHLFCKELEKLMND